MTEYAVIQFPGSNCDHDSVWIPQLRDQNARMVWHKETDLGNPDVVILPGGFSYGDYLRAGVIAKFSPIIGEVAKFAKDGGIVIGICNGFQVLTETGLLPGALMMNQSLQFICKHQHIRCEKTGTPFTNKLGKGQVLDIPIAHKEGNYHIDADGLQRLQDNDQIIFRYCTPDGEITDDANPNGSVFNIAGISNRQGNILGMMPHPERAAEDIVVSHDGMGIFDSIEAWLS